MVTTDRRDFETRAWPTVLVEISYDRNFELLYGYMETALMRILVAVPRRYNSKQPRTLINYAYQMAAHIRELVKKKRSTYVEVGDTVYGFNEDVSITRAPELTMDWFGAAVTFTMDYLESG